MNYSELLNPSQLAAVENTDGASVIVAGAGSGKTRVLTYKIAYLIEQGIPADNILALTFTNKAAREMKGRISDVVGYRQSRPIWMGTFHSIFSRILRIEAEKIGFTPQFTIYDTQDSKSLVKSIIKELALDEKAYKPGSVQNRISAAKNNMFGPREYSANREVRLQDNNRNMPAMAMIYEKYQNKLTQSNAMDFDDLLMKTAELLSRNPEVLEFYQDRFQYILVDEYQDTNKVQHQIVMMLARKYGNVCVVGDDAQSIYSFRGAEIENILSFRTQFADCKMFKLEQNYRSTQTIVNAANSLIAKNSRQIRKNVYSKLDVGKKIRVKENVDDFGEAKFVCEDIEKNVNGRYADYKDIAVLYRTNAQSRVLEDCCRRMRIPYKIYGGLSFYQRKEIKDVIAYLRLIVNHEDGEAFKRIINVPARGIGATTQQKLIDAKNANPQIDMLEILRLPNEYGVGLNKGAEKKVSDFGEMIGNLSKMVEEEKDAYSIVDSVMMDSGLMKDAAQDISVEGISRKENLQEFVSSVHEFCDKRVNDGETEIGLVDFLNEVALITDQDNQSNENADTITLMTMHSAKGLEFAYVYIVGLEEQLMPSAMAMMPKEIEEERRLMYVAVTRAKEVCTISYAQSRFLNGQHTYPKPSRFIEDIDEEYLERPGRRRHVFMSEPEVKFVSKKETRSEKVVSDEVLTNVEEGMRVRHGKFGDGTVIEVQNGGDRARVSFDEVGEKTLILKFARLNKLE